MNPETLDYADSLDFVGVTRGIRFHLY